MSPTCGRHAALVAGIAVAWLVWTMPASGAPHAAPASGAPQATSDDRAADIRARIEVVQQLMASDLPAAMAALDQLATDLEQAPAADVLDEDVRAAHRDLLLLQARAHLQLLDNERAEQSLHRLLVVDPTFDGELSPLEAQLLQNVRAREGGFLEIVTSEPGLTILVNGVQVGETSEEPFRFTLVSGEYEVRLLKDGYLDARATTTIEPDRVTTLSDLDPSVSIPPLALILEAAGIDVTLDARPLGTARAVTDLRATLPLEEAVALDAAVARTPFDPETAAALIVRAPLIDRSMELTFRRECYVDEIRTLTITTDTVIGRGADASLLWLDDDTTITLTPDTGVLRIDSMPAGAEVTVDDEPVGSTPLEREVCAGPHAVRVRHRVGARTVDVTVTRGSTESVEARLSPAVATLGAVDGRRDTLPLDEDLASALARVLSAPSLTIPVAPARPVAPAPDRESRDGWTADAVTRLVQAVDREAHDEVGRLLDAAADRFDASLFLAAARRPATPPGATGSTTVEVLVFSAEHPAPDRLTWDPSVDPDGDAIIGGLNRPTDGLAWLDQAHLGLEVADTNLIEASLIVARVDPGGPAEAGGVRPGDAIEAVDGTAMSAAELAVHLGSLAPGDPVELRLARGGLTPVTVTVPVRRRPARDAVLDADLLANVAIARLLEARFVAEDPDERALADVSLAAALMRIGRWSAALEHLAGNPETRAGPGVGAGLAQYFRGRCLEETGELEQARTAYEQAAGSSGVATRDGVTVATLARFRLSVLDEAAAPR